MKLFLTLILAITTANCMASDCRLFIHQQAEWHAGGIISNITHTALQTRQLVQASVAESNNGQFDFNALVETEEDSHGKLFAVLNLYSKEFNDDAPFFSTSVEVIKGDYAAAADQLIKNTVSCELLREIERQNQQ